MLSSFADDEALMAAVVAGASGYVLKEIRSGDLVVSIRRVASGESLLEPALTKRVIDRLRSGPPEDGQWRGSRSRSAGCSPFSLMG